MPATIVFAGSTATGTNNSSYTFSMSIGTPSTDRFVAVAIGTIFNPSTIGAPTITIDGVAATINASPTGGSTATAISQTIVACAACPSTRSSGDVTVVFNSTTNAERVGIGTFAIYGIVSSTAAATATSNSTSTTQTVSVNTTLGSVGVGAAYTNTVATATWTGATENFELDPEGVLVTGASFLATLAQTPRTVSVLFSTGSLFQSAASVVWTARSNFIDEITTRAPTPYGVIPPEMIGY